MAKSNDKPRTPAKPGKGPLPWDAPQDATDDAIEDDGPATVIAYDLGGGDALETTVPAGKSRDSTMPGRLRASGAFRARPATSGPGDLTAPSEIPNPGVVANATTKPVGVATRPTTEAPRRTRDGIPVAPAPAPPPPKKQTRTEMAAAAPVKKPTRGEMPAYKEAPKRAGDSVPPRRTTSRPEMPAAQPGDSKKPSRPSPAASRPSPSVAKDETKPIESIEEATEKKPPPQAGAYSRRNSKEVTAAAQAEKDDDAPRPLENTMTRLRRMDAKSRRLFSVVIFLGILAIGGAVTLLIWSGMRERPDVAELQVIYPYGWKGAHGPRGEVAPGAMQVSFKLVEEVPCGSHTTCLRYRYTGPKEFEGSMLVGKQAGGGWVRVDNEGKPFRPTIDSSKK